ncbi:hypothetical protein EMPS_02958 [Entomortierella parvispora]|uniref:Methyltransferase domain-containing protein n=1 Tax=Entomortierella parvispora TaxID=205924 RepID=A0A9P3H5V7_9FUNG|nr:hypothetical protein EMPS_02958 [Entomortierella parvispora]
MSEAEIDLMQDYINQRVHHRKPLQYILGTQPFLDLEILVRPPTLIPRWETEEWTGRLARLTRPRVVSNKSEEDIGSRSKSGSKSSAGWFNILDICTGSGCIPLGLASALPESSCRLTGIDIHDLAIQLARENEATNRRLLNNNPVQFHQADLFHPEAVSMFLNWQRTSFDLVVSNPPYIAHSEQPELEPEVSKWEDPKALMADEEGLVFYPKIAHMAMKLLKTKTRRNSPIVDRVEAPEIVLEIGGDHQADAVTASVREAGFTRVEVWKDLADRARCVVGSR